MALPELDHLTRDAADALDRGLEALQAAEHCHGSCVREGNPELARCIQLCRDVADLIAASTSLLVRGSGLQPKLTQLTLAACRTCADECADRDLRACQACRRALVAFAEAGDSLASGGAVDEDVDDDPSRHGGPSPFSGYFQASDRRG